MTEARDLSQLIKPRTQQNVSDQLYQQISQLIMAGALEEGYTFPNETVLCEQLKVGRTTLREAYKALELSGYVTRSKRGTTVNGRTAILGSTPIKNVFEEASEGDFDAFRRMLEPRGAGLAAARIEAEQLAGLRENVENAHVALARSDIPALVELDVAFHETIANQAGNSIITAMVSIMNETWRTRIRGNFEALRARLDVLAVTLDQHEEILDALEARDSAAAEAAMDAHLAYVSAALEG